MAPNGQCLKVSIALCTFNGARFLQAQLRSFCRQVRLPDELVVCDDGSTDGTLDLLTSFQPPFPMRVINNPSRLGSSKNFEQALLHCRYPVVLLADQDDVWHTEKVHILAATFEANHDLALAIHDAAIIDEHHHRISGTLWRRHRFSLRRPLNLASPHGLKPILRRNLGYGMTMAVRSRFLSRLTPFPQQCSHDAWLAHTLPVLGDLALLPNLLVDYRQHRGQQMPFRVEGGSLGQRIAQARTKSHRFRQEVAFLDQVTRWLAGWTDLDSQARHLINAKRAHLQKRLDLMSKKGKFAVILGELAKRRYHRYSNGFAGAVSDLLF